MSDHGPNVTKLITKFIARNAVPSGGGLADGLAFFTDPERRKQVLEKAEKEALAAIRLIKTAPDNPYGDDDEVIAGALVQKIEARREEQKRHVR